MSDLRVYWAGFLFKHNSKTYMNHSPLSAQVCALGLMAKAPLAGEVKTRLIPPLKSHEAAALNVCLLRDMAANIKDISDTKPASGLVVSTPPGSESAFAGVLPDGVKLLGQRGASLGERLCNATDDLLK